MGGCEPGQARDRAAISGYFHFPGVLVESRFFYGVFFELFYSPSWPESWAFVIISIISIFVLPFCYGALLNGSFFQKPFEKQRHLTPVYFGGRSQ